MRLIVLLSVPAIVLATLVAADTVVPREVRCLRADFPTAEEATLLAVPPTAGQLYMLTDLEGTMYPIFSPHEWAPILAQGPTVVAGCNNLDGIPSIVVQLPTGERAVLFGFEYSTS